MKGGDEDLHLQLMETQEWWRGFRCLWGIYKCPVLSWNWILHRMRFRSWYFYVAIGAVCG